MQELISLEAFDGLDLADTCRRAMKRSSETLWFCQDATPVNILSSHSANVERW